MKSDYTVSLSEFTVLDGVALARKGTTALGRMNSLELLQLMMIFQDISPIQHFEAEPTISISVRSGERFLVRTDLHRLMLYDTRQMQAPARVLEAASILLEIEDPSRNLRSQINAHLNKVAQETKGRTTPRESSGSLRLLPRLSGLAACLLVFVVALYFFLSTRDPVPAALQKVEAQKLLPLRQSLIGTYVTGANPGDFGITLLQTGEVRFLQLGNTPPEQQTGWYELGLVEGRLCVSVPGFLPIYPEGDRLRMGELVFAKR